MAMIPKSIKSLFSRHTVEERNDKVLLTRSEAKRWEEAQTVTVESDIVEKLKGAGFKVNADDETLLRAAQTMLTEGKLSPEQKVAAEAIAPQLFTLTTGDGEDPGFRRITSLATLRDLNPLMHDRMLQVCYFLSVTTPFGKRIVEIITDYTVGKGVRVTAKDSRVQEVIDAFWNDDVNNMDENVEQWSDELTRFGELCTPVAVNEVNGFVRVGYLDPMNIDTIQFAEMVTSDGTATINIPFGVRPRREVGQVAPKAMPIIRRSEDPDSESYGKLDGECFYWTINKAKSASRGFSELFSLADWIDLFDQMIFDFGDKVRFLNSFVWHYVIRGGTPKDVSDLKDRTTKAPPKQGGAFFSNEQVEINALTPDFKGADMAQGASMVKKYGWSGAGIPMVLTGDGDDANRASALEMNAPFTKKIQKRQNILARIISANLNFAIDKAKQAGVLPENVDASFSVEFPEIAVKDLQRGASTLQGATGSLQIAQGEGWITGATAARAFHTLLAEIGVDIEDSQEEYQLAQAEKDERARNQQDSFFPQKNLADAMRALGQPQEDDAAATDPDAALDDEGQRSAA